MHRAFGIDVLACPQCGGRLRLIATLHDPAVIQKILGHPRPLLFGTESWPGPSRARRRRILIESAWGAAGAGVSSSPGGIWAVSAGPWVD